MINTLLMLLCMWAGAIHGPLFGEESSILQLVLIPSIKEVKPGDEFTILVQAQLEEGWHLYWKNPGDSGLPPSFEWNIPEGITMTSFDWPAPTRFTLGDLIYYGYEGSPTWVARFASSDSIFFEEEPLSVVVSWLACKEACVPGKSEAGISLIIGDTTVINQDAMSVLAAAENELPKDVSAKASLSDNQLEIELPTTNVDSPANITVFFENDGIISPHKNIAWKVDQGVLKTTLPLTSAEAAHLANNHPLRAVISLQEGGKTVAFSFATTIDQLQQVITTASENLNKNVEKMAEGSSSRDLLLIAFLAFVGGIILNIMPCVLPVIGIKVLHLVQMKGQGRLQTFKLGLSFTLGVLVSFWLLAGIIFALQKAGTAVGWGFQLQEPLFVVAMIIVLFLFSLSLFGLFEFGTSMAAFAGQTQEMHGAPHSSQTASFMSGVLATVVACPCTGPLLGSVLGFTATLEWHTGLLVFSSLGFGVAFPFLLLSLLPELSIILPRPGPWMITFKQFLGFCMLATVLWLLWVLNAQVGPLEIDHLLVLFFIMSLGAWIWGVWAAPIRGRVSRFIAAALALLLVGGAGYCLVQRVRAVPKTSPAVVFDEGQWKPYSDAALQEALGAGKTVFVDFTAKWCLTCQTNKLALHSQKVMDAFAQNDVVLLVADWTRNDPAITQALRAIGRNSVPVYALYVKGAAVPVLLPEILTPELIIDALH